MKGRNEPVNIIQVLEVMSGVRQENLDILCAAIYANTTRVFNIPLDDEQIKKQDV